MFVYLFVFLQVMSCVYGDQCLNDDTPERLLCNITAVIRDYELARALLVRPPPYWGARMRKEKVIGVMALGGSNSNGMERWPVSR
jgi:hypothetical protein